MRVPITLVLCLVLCSWSWAGTLVLKRAWVKKYKDRATIDADFVVDKAHKKPNSAKSDGDMHFAGRSQKQVGLPVVAELVNAGQPGQKAAFDSIRANEGNGQSVAMSGVWRLWFEHPADIQVQFADFPAAVNTNPDHSFEIHPVTRFAGLEVEKSFDFIPGFSGHDPNKAFAAYNKLSVTVRASASAITLVASKSGFNYTHFRMRLMGKPKKLVDGGLMVFADVEDDAGPETDGDDPLARGIRMIFTPGTPAAAMLSGKGAGDEFIAIGIPRVNLNALYTAIEQAGTTQFSGKLPYEMIVVAVKAID